MRARCEGAAIVRRACRDLRQPVPASIQHVLLGCSVRCGAAVALATAPGAHLGPADASRLASAVHCADLTLRLGGSTRERAMADALAARALYSSGSAAGSVGTDFIASILQRRMYFRALTTEGGREKDWLELYAMIGIDGDAPGMRAVAAGCPRSLGWLRLRGVSERAIRIVAHTR